MEVIKETKEKHWVSLQDCKAGSVVQLCDDGYLYIVLDYCPNPPDISVAELKTGKVCHCNRKETCLPVIGAFVVDYERKDEDG